MRYSSNKDLDQFVEHLVASGAAKVRMTGSGHLRLDFPNGRTVFGPSTPSDWRGVLNFMSLARRAMRQPKKVRP